MTHEEQIEHDLMIYGVAVERLKPDGTIERLDPTTIRYIKAENKDVFFPTTDDTDNRIKVTQL